MNRFFLIAIDIVLIKAGFCLAFMVRYGYFPAQAFSSYSESAPWLTALYLGVMTIFGVYKRRFRSSWELFTKIALAMAVGTVLSVVFVYIFRIRWGAFPTSIFVIAMLINIILNFKVNQWLLKKRGQITKNVLVIGNGKVNGLTGKTTIVKKLQFKELRQLKIDYHDIDQIIITEEAKEASLAEYLTFIIHQYHIDLIYTPAIYMKLIREQVNGHAQHLYLRTFEGEKRDVEEFFIRFIDLAGSLCGLLLLSPVLGLIALAVKITSPGPAIYKQLRVGKDGKPFVIYKFRTMVQGAEKLSGFQPASIGDHRITPIGSWLRQSRLDELPQLFNILLDEMSLVGPRPENMYRVNSHKALQGIRLAVKPGLTGLAQIRSFYDLEPRHKIKYDYLYIQRRSLRLNLYILLLTIPALFSKKGW
jgi:lipopolysaccharide/colanic/teichoic acid biosynthesis glycosyltransferase